MSTQGKLLVSVPDLGDDNFDRAVILVVEHNDEGAIGLVLNHPSETEVAEHLPDLVDSVVSPAVFFVGGPVSIGGLLALGRRGLDADLVNAVGVEGPIVMVDPEALVNGNVEGVELIRLYTGYSGWGEGQLDAELASGVWHVIGAMPDDVLCSNPADLWRLVMKRQGGRLASQSLYPQNPHAN